MHLARLRNLPPLHFTPLFYFQQGFPARELQFYIRGLEWETELRADGHYQFVLVAILDTCHMTRRCGIGVFSAWVSKQASKYWAWTLEVSVRCVCLSARSFSATVSGPGGHVELVVWLAPARDLAKRGITPFRTQYCASWHLRAFACRQHQVIISPPVSKNLFSQAATLKCVAEHFGNALPDHFK